MQRNALDKHKSSYHETFTYHDDNALMLNWYLERMVEHFERIGVSSLLSLGIGHQIIARRFIERLADSLDRYVLLEGSKEILEEFRAAVSPPQNVQFVHSLFECYQGDTTFDAIEMGFVLEHVDDPGLVLDKFKLYLNPGGSIFIAVPNARSLHRQLGASAGLLSDLYALSEHDHQLGHQRYFDLESLRNLVQGAGLTVVRTEGLFLKPITTAQIRSLALPPEILEAFCRVGVERPDLCNAIMVEVTN